MFRHTYTYRSVVDVDIVGRADTPEKMVHENTKKQPPIYCSVLGEKP